MKDGKEINQRTFLHNLWSGTMIRGLTEGRGECEAGGSRGNGEKAERTVIA